MNFSVLEHRQVQHPFFSPFRMELNGMSIMVHALHQMADDHWNFWSAKYT